MQSLVSFWFAVQEENLHDLLELNVAFRMVYYGDGKDWGRSEVCQKRRVGKRFPTFFILF
jgi:hypothetical protein